MVKVLVVSDSHGLTNELMEIKAKHQDSVDLMIHCGDSELMSDHPALSGFTVVRGNCDWNDQFSEESIQEKGGKRIFVTHGHHHRVKSSLLALSYRAAELGVNIVCFGHSHILGAEVIGNVLFLNPGSIRLPRMRKEKTYCILEIINDKIRLNVYDINLGLLPELNLEFIVNS
ncbi:metallophosphoesterase family protein [Pseudoneobacillus sp. C159]